MYDVNWPAGALHRILLDDGSLVIGTTQGQLVTIAPDGKYAWSIRRPSRIDAVVVLKNSGQIAIARKDHPHSFDWKARPVVELFDLKTGTLLQTYVGPLSDDMGHYGTDLRLVFPTDEKSLYLGDWTGTIYRINR